VPWGGQFSWSSFNYAPLVTVAVMLAVTIWYLVSARRTFTGPVRTVEYPEEERMAPEPAPLIPGT
jgi:hypothetical protein